MPYFFESGDSHRFRCHECVNNLSDQTDNGYYDCSAGKNPATCDQFLQKKQLDDAFIPINQPHDAVNAPSHYVGKIECIDYLRDKLTPEEFVGFCMGNVLKYASRWRKKDGIQDLKKAKVYLTWAIEAVEILTNP